MGTFRQKKWVLFVRVTTLLLAVNIYGAESVGALPSYAPDADVDYPVNVFWGDTHLHTNLSVDAYLGKNKKLGPEEAYRFARGDTVMAHNGMPVRLRRPLDFLVVADHAFNLGLLASLNESNPGLLATEAGKRLYAQFQKIQTITDKSKRDAVFSEFVEPMYREKMIEGNVYQQSIWNQVTSNADKYNQPGNFTAFIGYEWTAWSRQMDLAKPMVMENAGNLHRVIIFKDDANKANQITPLSLYDSSNPEDLWQFLDDYERKTDGQALAIPHNGNLSKGEMFALTDLDGRPFSRAYAKTRSRWEPLYEVTQIKGDSETHPLLSPTDEFADYETWNGWFGQKVDQKKLNEKEAKYIRSVMAPNKKQYEYARSALKIGLGEQSRLGINPFKFGLVGSTDSHTSLATADENNFWGKTSIDEPRARRAFELRWNNLEAWEFSAAGYTAIWATENTREALFAAMKRKEVYATTGPRIEVRFFGGWDYQQEDALRPDLARIGYSKGVPMGGDLTQVPARKSPTFLIRAVKDPDGANLDRVQVIKGWRSANGGLHEKIYNVALSDGRKARWKGRVPSVGTTVNVKDASYINSIGAPELAIVWTDPDFKKDELAFYYLRVLEIPTPRWTAYDAKFFDIANIPDEVPMVTQERAYSSPIWYTP